VAENFNIDDFSQAEDVGNSRKYILNDTCIIFNKTYEEPLHLLIYKNFELSNYISEISEYINWLGGKCKEYLIKYFNENIKPGKKADDKWYEALAIYTVSINITEDGKIGSEISCGDKNREEVVLDIEMDGKEITSMNYW
jgi:hypothetical protein